MSSVLDWNWALRTDSSHTCSFHGTPEREQQACSNSLNIEHLFTHSKCVYTLTIR